MSIARRKSRKALWGLCIASVAALLNTGCKSPAETTANGFNPDEELEYCCDKVQHTIAQLGDRYDMMPRNICDRDSVWNCRPACPEEWCSGFWPGVIWNAYRASGDTAFLVKADAYTRALDTIVARPVFDHDLGFLMYCSYGTGYQLNNNPEYKNILLQTADSLATLYNPAVGTILAWPRNMDMFGGHNTIMDTMINLELLFWAARNGGSHDLYDIAVNHAKTTMAHHFRPDYTAYHVAVYDPVDGHFIRGCTHQGYSDDSMWARGQTWAIYGYTVVYRETRDPQFLEFAEHVADVYLDRLPADHVPYWDFNDPAIPNAPRDASAAAVAASALIELSDYADADHSERYLTEATEMLASLSSDKYKSGDRNSAFLLHSVGHHPAGSEIDASIIYADYYYIEALNRLSEHIHHKGTTSPSNLASK